MTERGQVNSFGEGGGSGLLRAERESPLRPCDPIPFTFDLTTSGICAHYSSVVIRTHALTHMLAHVRTHTHTHTHAFIHISKGEERGCFSFLFPDIMGLGSLFWYVQLFRDIFLFFYEY